MATVIGKYAHLSRGKHCAKHMPSGQWADRDRDGNLVLNKSGRWMLSTSDGFNRKETVYVEVDDDGGIYGDLRRAFREV